MASLVWIGKVSSPFPSQITIKVLEPSEKELFLNFFPISPPFQQISICMEIGGRAEIRNKKYEGEGDEEL